LVLLVKFYQYFISPLLGRNKCRYYPTCSQYLIISLKNFGLFSGLFLSIKRILSCHPFSKRDAFDMPIKVKTYSNNYCKTNIANEKI